MLYGELRKYLGQVLRELATQKESRVVEDSVREYIRRQEEEDRRLDQLNMFE